MSRSLAIACIVIFCMPQPSHAKDVPLGIWSWSQDSISTPEARTKLLDFCRDQGVSHIDQHVSIRKQGDQQVLQNPDQLAELIEPLQSLLPNRRVGGDEPTVYPLTARSNSTHWPNASTQRKVE